MARPETPAGEAPQVIDARPRNQPPLPECRMPGLAAGQNLPQAGRPRQAEVMDLRAAGVEFLDENGGGPGVRLRKQQHGHEGADKGDRNLDPTFRLARNSNGSIIHGYRYSV